VTLPKSEPFEVCPDSYLIERQNQKKVVLPKIVWHPCANYCE